MAEKLYYSMGEVAEMFDVKRSLIRHWESQFSVLKPRRTARGNRLFTPQDVEHLKVIYHLVKELGMTLEGAKRAMKRGTAADGPDGEMKREAELMARLKHIRALLVEVREDLKSGGEGIIADEDLSAEQEDASGAETDSVRRRKKPVVKIEPAEESAAEFSAEPAAETPVAEVPVVEAAEVGEEPSVQENRSEEQAVIEPIATEAASGAEIMAAESEVPEEVVPEGAPAAETSGEETMMPGSEQPAESESGATETEPAPAAPEFAAELPDATVRNPKQRSGAPRRPRRKSNDDENKELFAFYEQSLF